MSESNSAAESYLAGIRVLELADETGEYAGKVLAGLGADVVKIEPLSGERTRTIGPFRDDLADSEESLHFWHYNHGKRSVALDLDIPEDRDRFADLASSADVLLDTRPRRYLDERGIGYEQLKCANPGLIYARITPFGDDGPWADYLGSDLVHLALGGVMMNCGYDPDPFGRYDTPPIAPQMWHAYHIAGEMTVIGVLGALVFRLRSREGQRLVTSVHEAVSMNTETDMPDWIFLRQPHNRQTCRHSMAGATLPALAQTKDGRYLLPYRTYLRSAATYSSDAFRSVVAVLEKFQMDEGLGEPEVYERDSDAAEAKASRQVDRLAARLKFEADLWLEGQEQGLPWAPLRRPEENMRDAHWIERGSYAAVRHPESPRPYTYVGARWYSDEVPWTISPNRPPRLGEHAATVFETWSRRPKLSNPLADSPFVRSDQVCGPTGKPFALSGVRVVDLGWMLASAGASRFLAAMGAEVIKVEHHKRADGMRWGQGWCPVGGRTERDRATAPMPTPPRSGPNRSGAFMEVNAGKHSLSLNLKTPEGRTILEDLIRSADILLEGYSPGTLERMGFGYERLKQLNPAIVYVQQSGFGEHGSYGRARAFGPTAQAFSGMSEMSGLPEPYPPAGIGYSYLDWFGAYNMATAMIASLYRRAVTGKGCRIDASQAEIGIYLTGTATLDASVNRRRWTRYGNRSPHLPAAPHGAYRTRGEDRWIAIAAFTQEQWHSLSATLKHPEWLEDPRFLDVEQRRRNEDELDELVSQATAGLDGFDLMHLLQGAGVPAGVCQTAEDRYESDPQLRHLQWLVELPQTEIGVWPVKGFPVRMEASPAHPGGAVGRSGPNYGEHTEHVLTRVLGMTSAQIEFLRARDVV